MNANTNEINHTIFNESELATIHAAYEIFESKAIHSPVIDCSDYAKQLCQTKIGFHEHEVFAVAFQRPP